MIQDERLLLVNPNYKLDWDLPANGPPIDAAARELREELGLRVEIGALLCVDWIPPHGPWDDTLVFVFDGGTLPPGEIEARRYGRRAGRIPFLYSRRGGRPATPVRVAARSMLS